MKSIKSITKKVGKEIDRVLGGVDEKDTKKLVGFIVGAKRIFVTGSGRSGLVAEAFVMRLEQLGLKSCVIGDSEVKKGDVVIVISGSGKTKATNKIVKDVKKARICLITANKESEIAKMAELVIQIKAKTKVSGKSIEPLGSLFEQAVFVYLDSIVILLMKKLGKTEKSMRKRHSKVR